MDDSDTIEGHGLGMAITQEIVKALGLEMQIESEFEEGTVVTLRFV